MGKAIAGALMGNSALQTPAGITGTINSEPGIIVWADGHLLELAEPHDYNPRWEKWSLEDLPVFPEQLRFARMPIDSAKLGVVVAAMKNATIVVNACDAAREGELIFDEIAEYAGLYKKKTMLFRMWISDTTVTGLRTAFGFLKSHNDKALIRLRAQARVRSECDWLWGLNLTRYATLALRDKMTIESRTVSVGRVRSPVLGLIADRCRANALHQPEPFWQGHITFMNDTGERCEAKLIAPPELKYGIRDTDWSNHGSVLDRITHARSMVATPWNVIEGESKEAKEFAPPLFDLTELQRAANRLWCWSAKKTERIAQILYERFGAISYPRTDCDKLPQTMEADAMRLWRELYEVWMKQRFPDEMERLPTYEPESGANFAEKITDHFAIIPTSANPPPAMDHQGNMTETYQLWELIAIRFVTAWLPPALVATSSRVFTLDYVPGENLRALVKAAPVKSPGWLQFEDVIGSTRGFGRKLADRLQDKVLPPMGMTASSMGAKIVVMKTTPPEIFTYDMLLNAMVEHKLGTPATRGQQIEDSIKLNYIYEDNSGRLRVTSDGEQVVALLRAHGGEAILDTKLTAAWETQIDLVGKPGDKGIDRETVLENMILQIEDLGARMTAPGMVKEVVFCPKTSLLVQETEKGWRFAGWPELLCPFVLLQREMKATEYRDILMNGKKGAGPYVGFKSKTSGKEFRCHLVLSKDKRRFEPVFKR